MEAHQVTITFDEETMSMLAACAGWRSVSVKELVKAYVKDWPDIDYPEFRGRDTRQGLLRDGPITPDSQTRQNTSPSWRNGSGVSRLQSPSDK